MPLMHCMKCDHEWESTKHNSLCARCGEGGYVLEPETPMEKMMKDKGHIKKILREDKGEIQTREDDGGVI